MSRLDQRCLRPIMAMLCVIALQGCSDAGGLGGGDGGGDGGGIGGSGITPIAGSDFSYGTITGFGSVIINGERYSTDASRFLIDGVEGSQSDLALGMLVSADVDFERMTASSVFYEPTVSGPVTSIDLQTSRLNILGQSISITADTIVDDLVPADIRVGDFLQLTGNRSATGSIRATWMARAPTRQKVQVTGPVSNLQASESRFSIGALSIDFSTVADVALDTVPAAGRLLVVSAPASSYDAVSSALRASSITAFAPSQLESGRRIELEGIVDTVPGTERFSLNGHIVLTDNDTVIQRVGGVQVPRNSIVRNTRVEVEGSIDSNGSIAATRIVLIPGDESRLAGPIDSLDPAVARLQIAGIRVDTTTRTRYDGSSGSSGSGFSELGVGNYVEVDASFIDGRLVATRIKVEEPEDEVRLRGPVTALDVNASSLEVLGIPLLDTGDTEYESLTGGDIDRTTFLQSLRPTDLVEARWREFQSTALPPDEVEVEEQD